MSVEFVKVAKASDVFEKKAKLIRLDNEDIALWRVDGKFYAINNVCAHQHFSALHQGELDGLRVTCPMHGWTYSLETGKAEAGSGQVKTYRVKVEGENVFVGVERQE